MFGTSVSIEEIDPPTQLAPAPPAFTVRIRQAGQSLDMPFDEQSDGDAVYTRLSQRLSKLEHGLGGIMALYSIPVPEDSDPDIMIKRIGDLLARHTFNERTTQATLDAKDRAYEELSSTHKKTVEDLTESRSAHAATKREVEAQHMEVALLQQTHKNEMAAVVKERDAAQGTTRTISAECDEARDALRRVTTERDTASNTADRLRTERNTLRITADRLREERNTARDTVVRVREERDTARSNLSSVQDYMLPLRASFEEFLRDTDDIPVL